MRASSDGVRVTGGAPRGTGTRAGEALSERRRRAGAVAGGVVAGAGVLGVASGGPGRLFWAVPVLALLLAVVLLARGEAAP